MNDHEAGVHSHQATESGYADWIAAKVKQAAIEQFQATQAQDDGGLRISRILFDSAAIVAELINENARAYKKAHEDNRLR